MEAALAPGPKGPGFRAGDQVSGILPAIWFPTDLKVVQQQLVADAQGVDQTVSSCVKLDAATKTSWSSFYNGIKAFAAIDFGWTNTTSTAADQAQLLQRELYAWQQKLSGACALTVPSVDPTKTAGAEASTMLTSIVKAGAVIAGFLASAYIIKTVADVVVPMFPKREAEAAAE